MAGMIVIGQQAISTVAYDLKMTKQRREHEERMRVLGRELKERELIEKQDKEHVDYYKNEDELRDINRKQEKHDLEMQELRQKIETGARSLREQKDKDFEPRMKPRIDAINDNLKDCDSFKSKNSDLQAGWKALEAKDLSSEERKDKQQQVYKMIKDLEKESAQEVKDYGKLKKFIGEEKMAEFNFQNAISESEKKNQRRGLRRSSPQLMEEINTSCETEFCHRKWYTRSYPDLGKREAEPHEVLHDFHITPAEFDFDESSAFEKRDIDLDCQPIQDGLYGRIIAQAGGDESSALALGLLPPDAFAELLAKDIEKIGYVDVQGHKSANGSHRTR
ncbi:hypothetical protein N7492_009184 [Penicillium capsulatum]|uniref:Uncharacterized protein n=1 Tax=Penicillium capsulatum TaxID=69766 RepID=A0A9W9HUW0_9EURO|nr:hypothetical protein N7492_009184 [Penicillium capsulatum]KAJ6106580.1 hypothetical protein N7512_010097 [Penicillium capsulatum]